MRGYFGGRPVRGTWIENVRQQENLYRNRGRGHNERYDGPVYLENLEESEKIRQHHNDQLAGEGNGGYRGTRPPKSMSSMETEQGDKEHCEQNKLAASGMNGSTTEERMLNFTEVMSGEEVKEVSMQRDGKPLITIVEPRTGEDFTRIKNIFLP